MVEKMKLLHITGPKYDIDRVMKRYLNKYEIHFENAMTSIGNISNVRPFIETNIYKDDFLNGKDTAVYDIICKKMEQAAKSQSAFIMDLSLNMKNSVKSEALPPISNNEWLTLKAATFKHFYSVHLEVDLCYIKEIK